MLLLVAEGNILTVKANAEEYRRSGPMCILAKGT
jgi:hypothetical protein